MQHSSFCTFAVMLKKITCAFFACMFLLSSIVLPLGDFSLLRDIPVMYRNYTRITSADEMGVVDFIGDYLLHGKDIFGHNQHDKVPSKGNEVQFQHQASPLNIVIIKTRIQPVLISDPTDKYALSRQQFKTTVYHDELFRPPLG